MLSGSRHELLSFAMCPAALNALSEGTEVAGIAKYCLASCMRVGYLELFSFHHWSGLSKTGSSLRYLHTAAFVFSTGHNSSCSDGVTTSCNRWKSLRSPRALFGAGSWSGTDTVLQQTGTLSSLIWAIVLSLSFWPGVKKSSLIEGLKFWPCVSMLQVWEDDPFHGFLQTVVRGGWLRLDV